MYLFLKLRDFQILVKSEILNSSGIWTCLCGLQDFPEGGAPTPKSAIILHIFCQKLHENERIWEARASLVAPLGSANGTSGFQNPLALIYSFKHVCGQWTSVKKSLNMGVLEGHCLFQYN